MSKNLRLGAASIAFSQPLYIESAASIVSQKEADGPLGDLFDLVCEDPMFGCDTWESAESTLQKETATQAISKAGLSSEDIHLMFAGDLLAQTSATCFGSAGLGIPFYGQNGACSGYFYAETRIPRVFLNNGNAALSVYEKVNSGDLISTYLDKITLKKGHVYSVTISGSLQVVSNESNNSGNYSIQMTDGYDDDLCREVTRIKRDGEKIAQTNDQHSFNFTRIYDASDEDITLYFMFEQSAYNTRLESFKGTITITALD